VLRKLKLADWLLSLPADDSSHVLLGGTGHLLLSAQEQAQAIAQLEKTVLPALFSGHSGLRVTLISCLAPGADLLFQRVCATWLRRAGIAYRAVALLPLPVNTLISDWLQKARDNGLSVDACALDDVQKAISTALAACETVVDLLPPTYAHAELADLEFRQAQYRRLAACLAEQPDQLIAVLRGQSPQLPGGTAEVVEWRRNPALIPAEFSTLALRTARRARRALHIVDPQATPAPASAPMPTAADAEDALVEHIRQCQQALKAGNYLQAYDQTVRAKASGVTSRTLDYLSVLALANAGSTQLGLQRYYQLQLAEHELGEDWLALEGRLLKDLALSRSADRALFLRSGAAYHAAFQRTGGYFPAINAATMFLLGGEAAQSAALAQAALAQTRAALPADETDDYYRCVTAAEALLLLRDLDGCGANLRRANQLLRGNVNVRSRAAAQLRLICRHHAIDTALLDNLTLAPVVCALRCSPEVGVMPAVHAAFVFATLIAPADLGVVEALAKLDSRLHLILSAPKATLLEAWRTRYDDLTAQRLHRCLQRADEVSVANGFLDEESHRLADYVATVALGLSKLTAKRLGCGWQVLALNDDARLLSDEEADAVLDRRCAANTPPAPTSTVTFARQFVGTIFADFTGFSRLSEAEMPRFQTLHFGAIADVLKRAQAKILRQHTWGDAVHIVTADAESAADLLVEIHAAIEQLRPQLDGTLAQLELRLAAHYAPVYAGIDPVENTPVYFGSQLSFAARIEPVTPPGMIFVTEAFAARLALEAPERFVAEYAGEIELAKRYGQYRLFSLRAAAV
jgi:class 3 adenylate cyclase